MEAIFALIIEYVAIWAPSLVAVLGVVSTVLLAIAKCKEAAEKLKNDTTIKDMRAEFKQMASENAELTRTVKLLLDEKTKIRGYADAKKKEE